MSYRCPDKECLSTELDVQITTWAYLDQEDPDNVETDTDAAQVNSHEWDNDSKMRCRECGYVATVDKFEVEDEPEEDEEQLAEGDWVTMDHRTFTQHEYPKAWRDRVEVSEDEDWKVVLGARMEEDQFWPNTWFISDHGNLNLLTLEPEKD